MKDSAYPTLMSNSPTGELLLNLNEVRGEGRLFVIYPKINKVGVPNPRHVFFLPGDSYSRYVPPRVVYTDDPGISGRTPDYKYRRSQ
jgi:hypothetical protein